MSFNITIQENPPLIRVVMRGFWTMETFGAYIQACGAAMQDLMARHGRFDMLSECTDFPVQGPEVSAAFERLNAMSDPTSQNRIAVVSPSALARMQAQRLLGNPQHRIFASEAAALEWLGLA